MLMERSRSKVDVGRRRQEAGEVVDGKVAESVDRKVGLLEVEVGRRRLEAVGRVGWMVERVPRMLMETSVSSTVPGES